VLRIGPLELSTTSMTAKRRIRRRTGAYAIVTPRRSVAVVGIALAGRGSRSLLSDQAGLVALFHLRASTSDQVHRQADVLEMSDARLLSITECVRVELIAQHWPVTRTRSGVQLPRQQKLRESGKTT
jgi:hypothetical protein